MKRLVFTFGTLYEPTIIKALFGEEPPSFLTRISGYGVFKGTVDDLSPEIKADIASKRDLTDFSFLFAKKDHSSTIEGKVYEITTNQELILDWWERYPKWYRKEDVLVIDPQGNQHEAFMYAIDKGGKKLENFERVQGDLNSYLESATNLRNRLQQEFPKI